MLTFKIYWKNGTVTIIKGFTIGIALLENEINDISNMLSYFII